MLLIYMIPECCLQTVEGQKRKLEESEQLLNQRKYVACCLWFVIRLDALIVKKEKCSL